MDALTFCFILHAMMRINAVLLQIKLFGLNLRDKVFFFKLEKTEIAWFTRRPAP